MPRDRPFLAGISALAAMLTGFLLALPQPARAQAQLSFFEWRAAKQNTFIHDKAVFCKRGVRLGRIGPARHQCYTALGLINYLLSVGDTSTERKAWLNVVKFHIEGAIDEAERQEARLSAAGNTVVIESGVTGGGVATGSSGNQGTSTGAMTEPDLAMIEPAAGGDGGLEFLDTDVFFNLNSASLSDEDVLHLKKHVGLLSLYMQPSGPDVSGDSDLIPAPPQGEALAPNTARIQIVATTDPSGPAAFNLDLSRKRAETVANVLMDYGVPSELIAILPLGESPSGIEEAGKPFNPELRRVRVLLD